MRPRLLPACPCDHVFCPFAHATQFAPLTPHLPVFVCSWSSRSPRSSVFSRLLCITATTSSTCFCTFFTLSVLPGAPDPLLQRRQRAAHICAHVPSVGDIKHSDRVCAAVPQQCAPPARQSIDFTGRPALLSFVTRTCPALTLSTRSSSHASSCAHRHDLQRNHARAPVVPQFPPASSPPTSSPQRLHEYACSSAFSFSVGHAKDARTHARPSAFPCFPPPLLVLPSISLSAFLFPSSRVALSPPRSLSFPHTNPPHARARSKAAMRAYILSEPASPDTRTPVTKRLETVLVRVRGDVSTIRVFVGGDPQRWHRRRRWMRKRCAESKGKGGGNGREIGG